MGPVPQGAADGHLGARGPDVVAGLAVGVEDLVIGVLDPLAQLGSGARRDGLEVLHDLGAEEVEGQVIDVVAEGVLHLPADEQDREDDDRRGD